jgi:hypothetical protein|tara:strand:- start:1288 stop:1587 length:300 start_codon:yes stop_codon:yes gene_type:complete
MLSKIKKVKDKVEYLLDNFPLLRDSDNKLIAKIWWEESSSSNTRDFLLNFGNGNHTSPEAIRRARQKLQEHNPHLRGNLYNKRHQNGATVKSHIKFVNF